jgi:photosystem II stability/assembly factor-like uncharacterized protein
VLLLVVLLLAGCSDEEPGPTERWVVEEIGTRAEFRDVFFLDANRGWIVGGGTNIEGGIVGSTTDGGRTWSFRSAIIRPSRRANTFLLHAVWFIDDRKGFLVGDGFHVLRTVDGGAHWHRVAPSRGVWAHLRDLQFVDSAYGWAVGNGGLVRTIDGGATWKWPVVVDPETERTDPPRGTALHFRDRSRGWIAGKFGVILATTDGGDRWRSVNGPPATGRPDLWGLDFGDDVHGWAVGEQGTILATRDGGETWRRQSSGVQDILMDVDFVDDSRGWVVGFDRPSGSAVVLRTRDGGATWEEQARVETESMQAVFALDAEHAWAVGAQQRRTPDDGTQKLLRYEASESELESLAHQAPRGRG